MTKGATLRVVGQDLRSRRHSEHSGLVIFAPQQAQVQRAFYDQVSFDF